MIRMIGRLNEFAICSAIKGLALIDASAEPPRTVKSSPTTTTGRPPTLARPKTQFAGITVFRSPLGSYSPTPEIIPVSWKLPLSAILSIRSRTVSRPESCCRLILSAPPISRAKASRRVSSSSSGFQFMPGSVSILFLAFKGSAQQQRRAIPCSGTFLNAMRALSKSAGSNAALTGSHSTATDAAKLPILF